MKNIILNGILNKAFLSKLIIFMNNLVEEFIMVLEGNSLYIFIFIIL